MTVGGGGLGEVSIATRTPTERFVAVPKVGADAAVFEERALWELFSLALCDPLTRLYNAAYFAERLLGELALTPRQGTTLAVVLLDIDQLKTLNAQRGHQAGDAVLSIGIAQFGEHDAQRSVSSILAGARLAVAAAKRQGTNRIATAAGTGPASEHP